MSNSPKDEAVKIASILAIYRLLPGFLRKTVNLLFCLIVWIYSLPFIVSVFLATTGIIRNYLNFILGGS